MCTCTDGVTQYLCASYRQKVYWVLSLSRTPKLVNVFTKIKDCLRHSVYRFIFRFYFSFYGLIKKKGSHNKYIYIPIIKICTQKKIVRNVKIATTTTISHLINQQLKTLIINFFVSFDFFRFFKSLLAVLFITVSCCISRSPFYLVQASFFSNALNKTPF